MTPDHSHILMTNPDLFSQNKPAEFITLLNAYHITVHTLLISRSSLHLSHHSPILPPG